MNERNAFLLEAPSGETIRMLGCNEDDCQCTTLIMTYERRGKTRKITTTLPRYVLEYLRDGIDAILEYHDLKILN